MNPRANLTTYLQISTQEGHTYQENTISMFRNEKIRNRSHSEPRSRNDVPPLGLVKLNEKHLIMNE